MQHAIPLVTYCKEITNLLMICCLVPFVLYIIALCNRQNDLVNLFLGMASGIGTVVVLGLMFSSAISPTIMVIIP